MKVFLKFLTFCACTGIIMFGAWYMTKSPHIDPTLESLLKMKAIANQTKDILNETGVKSDEDITFKLVDDKIEFHYGKHKFVMKKEQLSEKEFTDMLTKLGLTITKTEKGSLIIKYKDIPIKQVV